MSWQDKIIDAGVALREQEAEIARVHAHLEQLETEYRLARAAFAELVRGQQTSEVDGDDPPRKAARSESSVRSARKRDDSIKVRLLEILRGLDGGAHWKALASEVGASPKVARACLYDLKADGRIRSPAKGYYELAGASQAQPPESPSAPPPESPVTDSGQRVLRILEEAQRPVSIRTLAVASTLPREAVVAVLDRLQRAGKVTLDRDQASAVSEPQTSSPSAHPFVVRRNGEPVRRTVG